MNEMIAYCGLTCHSCPILLATIEKDVEKKAKMRVEIARQIKEHYGQECKPKDVGDCDGCQTEGGRLFSGCRNCQVRKCASQKKVETCAHCDEYVCEKLEKFFAIEPGGKEHLDAIRSKLESGEEKL